MLSAGRRNISSGIMRSEGEMLPAGLLAAFIATSANCPASLGSMSEIYP
jgi:hypothetical protein